MMSIADPQPELPDGEELAAYLDGELSPQTCRRIEERLATDSAYRRQLQELDQAWEALDKLPRTTARDEFVRTTMDMVTLAAERDVAAETSSLPALRRRRILLLAAACAVTASLGFAAAHVLAPDPNEPLLADLPTIVQVDLLPQIDTVDFLQRLAQLPLDQFVEDKEELQRNFNELQSAAAATPDDRRHWVEQLSPDQRAALATKWKRFQTLSPAPEAQTQLRDLEQQISQAPDADKLRQTLLAYGQWLAHRTPGEQAELRSLPTDERLRRVRQFARRDQRQAARELSPEDARALREAVFSMAEERRQALVERMRREGVEHPERRLEGRRSAVALFIVLRELHDDETRDAVAENLTSRLSPSAREYLNSLRESGPRPPGQPGARWRERQQLWQWVRDALQPKLGSEELERFFDEELDYNQRERLLSLPADEMQAELERLYIGAGAQLGLRDMEGLRDFADPGRFGRERRGPRRPMRGPEGGAWEPGRRGPPPPDGFNRDRFDRRGPPPGRPPDDRRGPDRRPPGEGPPPPPGEADQPPDF